ncbi:sensor histidine kinase [Salinisphaera sp. Q1T1-3]|uniref:sensor histidine kinase n=1 Tax=Salinisphaera sp. Q1T1-3 TaxID=2321229 RepID=UPI000E74F660|nr:histidine kinase [Salinisphaera sp. Q1T1-3]RJS91395.1 hypothetical protein D3260_15430 [Salinisphaera sp. Q1T1-3]
MPLSPDTRTILPDFCTGARILRVLAVCEAVAIILALGSSRSADVWRLLFLLSVYLQWIGIVSAAALCLIRRQAANLSTRQVMLVSYISLLLITFVITEITLLAGPYTGFWVLLEGVSPMAFVMRSLGISGVVGALGLRYFWLRASWQARAETETQARLEALQARIEPHFLFNALNSAAALTAVRPVEAETALEDLAALLRARLSGGDAPGLVTLADEMTLIEAYVRIEKLRLSERLTLERDISEAARRARLPSLSIQPLVENAIGHGVARLPEGGTVSLTAWLDNDMLHVRVRNPMAYGVPDVPGHRQAIANIRNRLALTYGDAAQLDFVQDEGWFTVLLIVPQRRDE